MGDQLHRVLWVGYQCTPWCHVCARRWKIGLDYDTYEILCLWSIFSITELTCWPVPETCWASGGRQTWSHSSSGSCLRSPPSCRVEWSSQSNWSSCRHQPLSEPVWNGWIMVTAFAFTWHILTHILIWILICRNTMTGTRCVVCLLIHVHMQRSSRSVFIGYGKWPRLDWA